MTYNEFKFCCMMFTKAFEGKKYGEVVKECYSMDNDCIISFEKLIYNHNYFGYGKCDNMFEFGKYGQLFVLLKKCPNGDFKTVESFLNYFEIPFKDIV